MITAHRFAALALMSFGLLACPQSDSNSPPAEQESASTVDSDAVSPDVAQAIAVRADLEARPDQTEAVLSEHGLTIVDFEALMMRIAADPVLAAAYRVGASE